MSGFAFIISHKHVLCWCMYDSQIRICALNIKIYEFVFNWLTCMLLGFCAFCWPHTLTFLVEYDFKFIIIIIII